jgi:transcriptional regulator with GAF, ATPase, and Fis domain
VSRFNRIMSFKPSRIWSYGIALLSVASAWIFAQSLHLGRGSPATPFFCAIVLSAWYGGVGPALLAMALAHLGFLLHHNFAFSLGLLMFTVSNILLAGLSIAQRNAKESLRESRDDLERTVQDLQATNEALLAESRERKHTEEELRKAFEEINGLRDQLYRENLALKAEVDQASMFEEIVGASKALHVVLSRVSKVAPTDSTVLIIGETGTGKELIARAVHKRSQRSSRPFVSVNCGAIPRDLIASELFGHEKGAFTGATQRRMGRFELAEGGTIFLDEIAEVPAETQIALLRVLQEREFERIGGTATIETNVRVITATNRDLQAAIAAGTFRSDLFYRLNVFPIEVPPLRERQEDIPVLVAYFVDRFARKSGKSVRSINKKSLELLQSYSWPGNIRELQNVIERSVIVCDTENLSVDERWLSRQPVAGEPTGQPELSRRLAVQEKEMIESALRESGGRVSGPSGAAAKLGIPGSTLYSKIGLLRIDKKRFKTKNHPTDQT